MRRQMRVAANLRRFVAAPVNAQTTGRRIGLACRQSRGGKGVRGQAGLLAAWAIPTHHCRLMRAGRRRSCCYPSRSTTQPADRPAPARAERGLRRSLLLERVLHLLAGLLELAGPLVFAALGLESLVGARLPDALLDVSGGFLGLVMRRVIEFHGRPFSDPAERRPVAASERCQLHWFVGDALKPAT